MQRIVLLGPRTTESTFDFTFNVEVNKLTLQELSSSADTTNTQHTKTIHTTTVNFLKKFCIKYNSRNTNNRIIEV